MDILHVPFEIFQNEIKTISIRLKIGFLKWRKSRLRWLIKAMRDFFLFCSLNIISSSNNLLFCSHKKYSLLPQHINLFPQYIILFPQHIILLPQYSILFPQHIILFPQYIILFPQYIILFPQYIILASVVRLSVRPSLTFHSKTFASEDHGTN